MRRSAADRGSMTPIVAGICVALTAMGIGGVTLGRIVAVKKDSQRAADAAVLMAAEVVRERGFPFDAASRTAAESAGSANVNLPVSFALNVRETADAVEFEVVAQAPVRVSPWIFASGVTTVSARAKGKVTQNRFDDAERRYPKLALVLDYSGSMNQIMPGSGGQSAIRVLRDSVRGLLDAALRVEYGAVLYSSNVLDAIPVAPGSENRIKSSLGRGANGMTCTSCGLNRARQLLLAAQNTGRYVVLVSDGAPNNGGGESGARAAARDLWGSDVTIFTLHIDWSGGSDTRLRNFMISVSGTPSSRGDTGYYYRATDASTLRRTFEEIVASIVCTVGPVNPAPTSPAELRVYLRDGAGRERALPPVADLAANRGIEAYRYEAATRTLKMTEAACDAIIDRGDEAIVRIDRPVLSE